VFLSIFFSTRKDKNLILEHRILLGENKSQNLVSIKETGTMILGVLFSGLCSAVLHDRMGS